MSTGAPTRGMSGRQTIADPEAKRLLWRVALGLVKRNIYVFPLWWPVFLPDGTVRCACPRGRRCPSIGKHPINDGWQQRASIDHDQIDRWFDLQRGEYPDANLGIFLGPSRLLVLDRDVRADGDGVATMQALQAKLTTVGTAIPFTWVQRTPSGGLHTLLQLPEDFDWRTDKLVGSLAQLGLGPHVDVKYGGGLIVGPGSIGASGAPYVMLGGEDGAIPALCAEDDPLGWAPAACPPVLLDLLRRAAPVMPAGAATPVKQTLLFLLAQRVGALRMPIDNDKYGIICFWAASCGHPGGHDDGTESSTVLTGARRGSRLGGFSCLHAKCAGRSSEDVLRYFGDPERFPGWIADADRMLDHAGIEPLTGTSRSNVPGELKTVIEDGRVPQTTLDAGPPLVDRPPEIESVTEERANDTAATALSTPSDLNGTVLSSETIGEGTSAQQPQPIARRRRRFTVLDDAALDALPRLEFLIQDVLGQRTTAVAYGAAGSGKSFLALDLVLCVATGTEWHGKAVQAGMAVYVGAEGGAGLGPRVRAWKIAHHITNVPGVRFVLEPVNLLSDHEVQAFLTSLTEAHVAPVLVVIDTLARCLLGGDENSARDMGVAVAALDRIRVTLGCTVCVVHHTGKSGEMERGSTALRGAADTMLSVTKSEDVVMVSCAKQKDDPDFPAISLTLVPVADDQVHSCVLKDTPARAGALAGSKLLALQILSYFTREGASYTRWLGATKLDERTFLRARKDLIDEKYVQKEGEGRGKPYVVTRAGLAALESSVTGSHLRDTCTQVSRPGQPSPATPAHPFRGAGVQAGDGNGSGAGSGLEAPGESDVYVVPDGDPDRRLRDDRDGDHADDPGSDKSA